MACAVPHSSQANPYNRSVSSACDICLVLRYLTSGQHGFGAYNQAFWYLLKWRCHMANLWVTAQFSEESVSSVEPSLSISILLRWCRDLRGDGFLHGSFSPCALLLLFDVGLMATWATLHTSYSEVRLSDVPSDRTLQLIRYFKILAFIYLIHTFWVRGDVTK